MRKIKGRLSAAHLLFSLLLLNSLIMSDRKSRRTSINSVLGAEFFSKVAITLRITNIRHKIQVKHTGECQFFYLLHISKRNRGLLGFWIFTVESGSRWGVWTTCVHTCSVRIWGGVERRPSHTWHTKNRYSRGETICYLIQSIVSCHGHSVGVQHELLSQKSKEAVCVHDLHLPPVDAPT